MNPNIQILCRPSKMPFSVPVWCVDLRSVEPAGSCSRTSPVLNCICACSGWVGQTAAAGGYLRPGQTSLPLWGGGPSHQQTPHTPSLSREEEEALPGGKGTKAAGNERSLLDFIFRGQATSTTGLCDCNYAHLTFTLGVNVRLLTLMIILIIHSTG